MHQMFAKNGNVLRVVGFPRNCLVTKHALCKMIMLSVFISVKYSIVQLVTSKNQ